MRTLWLFEPCSVSLRGVKTPAISASLFNAINTLPGGHELQFSLIMSADIHGDCQKAQASAQPITLSFSHADVESAG